MPSEKLTVSQRAFSRNLRRLIQKELEDPMAARIIDAFEHPITQISCTARDGAVQLYTL